jgi:hypothetical protein
MCSGGGGWTAAVLGRRVGWFQRVGWGVKVNIKVKGNDG